MAPGERVVVDGHLRLTPGALVEEKAPAGADPASAKPGNPGDPASQTSQTSQSGQSGPSGQSGQKVESGGKGAAPAEARQ